MVKSLEASEKNTGYRGSKSVTVLSLNPLLIFAHYNFISFIFSFPVLHSKVSLFSSTSALLVHVKHSRTALLTFFLYIIIYKKKSKWKTKPL